jgi:hypothetical protein
LNNPSLPTDNAARARYARLCAALGGEPPSPIHRAALARLSAWTDHDDIEALAELIREAIKKEERS